MLNFIHIQTVNTLADTKGDTAAVTIKGYHCYYIITCRKTGTANLNLLNDICLSIFVWNGMNQAHS
jgi:hypothetical protein